MHEEEIFISIIFIILKANSIKIFKLKTKKNKINMTQVQFVTYNKDKKYANFER